MKNIETTWKTSDNKFFGIISDETEEDNMSESFIYNWLLFESRCWEIGMLLVLLTLAFARVLLKPLSCWNCNCRWGKKLLALIGFTELLLFVNTVLELKVPELIIVELLPTMVDDEDDKEPNKLFILPFLPSFLSNSSVF